MKKKAFVFATIIFFSASAASAQIGVGTNLDGVLKGGASTGVETAPPDTDRNYYGRPPIDTRVTSDVSRKELHDMTPSQLGEALEKNRQQPDSMPDVAPAG